MVEKIVCPVGIVKIVVNHSRRGFVQGGHNDFHGDRNDTPGRATPMDGVG